MVPDSRVVAYRSGSGNFKAHGKDGGSAGDMQGLETRRQMNPATNRKDWASSSAWFSKLVALPNGPPGGEGEGLGFDIVPMSGSIHLLYNLGGGTALLGRRDCKHHLSYPDARDVTTALSPRVPPG